MINLRDVSIFAFNAAESIRNIFWNEDDNNWNFGEWLYTDWHLSPAKNT